jgi:2-keto-3-deoxy-L-rhamnonate aldolase RhmA
LAKVRALSGTDTASIVRIPANDPVYVKKALDMGASGVMAPNVNSAEDAAALVASMRYAPNGIRGMASGCRAADYGFKFKEYFREINDALFKAVQIETKEAVENIDAIAAVDGVDMLFIGHSDLTASLGIYGDYQNEMVLDIERKVLAACERHGKTAGLIARGAENIARYVDSGFKYVVTAVDTSLLKNAMSNAASVRF